MAAITYGMYRETSREASRITKRASAYLHSYAAAGRSELWQSATGRAGRAVEAYAACKPSSSREYCSRSVN